MLGRFTDGAVTFYEKLTDLHHAQKTWSEKQFGPAIERDARGPLDHLKKECGELYELIELWNEGKLPPEKNIDSEIADLIILVNDVLWRTGRKWDAAITAALLKMKENVNREWPPHKPWVEIDESRRLNMGGVGISHVERVFTNGEERIVGDGRTAEEAGEAAFRAIRNKNARAVEHVREEEWKFHGPIEYERNYWVCTACKGSLQVGATASTPEEAQMRCNEEIEKHK